MKIFSLVLIIVALSVYLTGVIWYFIDKGKGGHKKAPMILRAIGALMMVAYFIMAISGFN